MTERVSVILDLSGYKMDRRMALLQAYLETLWDKAGALRRLYQIILEEARNWIPQGQPTSVKDVLISIATEGRKRGLGIVIIGQRSSSIDKNVLTQAGDDGRALNMGYWLNDELKSWFPNLTMTEIVGVLRAACEVK